jgi:acyl-CoA thioester hydrolase
MSPTHGHTTSGGAAIVVLTVALGGMTPSSALDARHRASCSHCASPADAGSLLSPFPDLRDRCAEDGPHLGRFHRSKVEEDVVQLESGVGRVPVVRRYSDVDGLGHIHNIAYFDYLQEARAAYLDALGQFELDVRPQVVVAQDLRYVRSLDWGFPPIVVETRVVEVRQASYVIGYRVLDETGELVAHGTSTLATVDGDSMRPVRLHAELRAALTSALSAARDAEAQASAAQPVQPK